MNRIQKKIVSYLLLHMKKNNNPVTAHKVYTRIIHMQTAAVLHTQFTYRML